MLNRRYMRLIPSPPSLPCCCSSSAASLLALFLAVFTLFTTLASPPGLGNTVNDVCEAMLGDGVVNRKE